MTNSPQKHPGNYADSVRNVICLLTAADRQSGKKTIASLELQADALQMPKRRPRSLFERDRMPFCGFDEYTRVLLLGARYLRRVADRLRDRAERWDTEADLLELKHRQLTLWRGQEWSQSNGGEKPLKHAA